MSNQNQPGNALTTAPQRTDGNESPIPEDPRASTPQEPQFPTATVSTTAGESSEMRESPGNPIAMDSEDAPIADVIPQIEAVPKTNSKNSDAPSSSDAVPESDVVPETNSKDSSRPSSPDAVPESEVVPETNSKDSEAPSSSDAVPESEVVPETNSKDSDALSSSDTVAESEVVPETNLKDSDALSSSDAVPESEVVPDSAGPSPSGSPSNSGDIAVSGDITDSATRDSESRGKSGTPDSTGSRDSDSTAIQKRKRSRKPKIVTDQPVRKSNRLNDTGEDPVLSTNYGSKDDKPAQDRKVIPPTGLVREPFKFMEETIDPAIKKLQKALRMDVVIEKEYLQMKEDPKIQIGDDFQADLVFGPHKMEDRDEAVWVSPDDEELASTPLGQKFPGKELQDAFHYLVRNVYWRAIWMQFEGQIPFEVALRHLKLCHYDFGYALETIDECLKELPQKFKPVCVSQAKLLKEQMNKGLSRRELQEEVLKNYCIGEVHNFIGQFRRFYELQEKYGIPCNCHDPLCIQVKFETRFACKNCSKHLRDTSAYSQDQICLICLTYEKFTGTERSAINVYLNDEEILKIQTWNSLEEKHGKKLSKEAVEEMMQSEKNQRYMEGNLTSEEMDMYNPKDVRIPNRHTNWKLTTDQETLRRQKICGQLQPFKLPLFSKCWCKLSGNIYKLSKNYNKKTFNKREEVNFCKVIGEMGGDVEKAAKKLGVEEELVERFLDKYKGNGRVWKKYPNNTFHLYPTRHQLSPTNLPLAIPTSYLKASDVPKRPIVVEREEGSSGAPPAKKFRAEE